MLEQDQSRRPGPRSETFPTPQSSYCVITRREHGSGGHLYRVWRRTTDDPEAQLIGDYAHLDAARSSLPIDWRDGRSGNIFAWAFFTP